MSCRRKHECLILKKEDNDESICYWTFVWAKWKKTYWPAFTIKPDDCAVKNPDIRYMWVFWFADHKISLVLKKNLLGFTANFKDLFMKASSNSLQNAIDEALEVLAIASNYMYQNRADIFEWSRNGFNGSVEQCSEVPSIISNYLDELKEMNMEYSSELSSEEEIISYTSWKTLDNVKKGLLKIENICLGCYSKDTVAQHPLFKGSLCMQCKNRLMETIYAIGDDGKNMCCVLCSQPGELLLCDNLECSCSYCLDCITALTDKETTKKILELSPWRCVFCCTSKLKSRINILEKRWNWEESLQKFFQPSDIPRDMPELNYGTKMPIRVLSLFDGISAGKVALEKIGIEIDQYYASEIDEACLSVTRSRHGNSILYLGDISSLSEEKISSICPVDLVMGGSPCNDLSLVNPNRKGLYDNCGTGRLFFDFVHILQTVKRFNQGRHLFFLYENVASMSLDDKSVISDYLMCEPALIDAKYVSAQCRARYYWGNIPGLYAHSHMSYENENNLDSCLVQGLGRRAKVKKIRTVTTNKRSLKQDCMMPVEINGVPDTLWSTELERSLLKMPGKCSFKEEWISKSKDYDKWLRPVQGDKYRAFCSICKSSLDVSHSG